MQLTVCDLHAGSSNTDFLDWLRSTLAEALKASAQHESLRKVVRELRASIEGKFYLAAVQASIPLICHGLWKVKCTQLCGAILAFKCAAVECQHSLCRLAANSQLAH